jgi:hypothetical protein
MPSLSVNGYIRTYFLLKKNFCTFYREHIDVLFKGVVFCQSFEHVNMFEIHMFSKSCSREKLSRCAERERKREGGREGWMEGLRAGGREGGRERERVCVREKGRTNKEKITKNLSTPENQSNTIIRLNQIQ